LVYYGYRFYNASVGRWSSRDPIQEEAFTVLVSDDSGSFPEGEVDGEVTGPSYVFVSNCAVSQTDALGLWPSSSPWYGRFINLGTAIPTTHENANIRTIPGTATDTMILNMATVFVDNGQGQQDPALSYQHAMRAPHQSKAIARALANLWAKRNMIAAQKAYCGCGEMDHVAALWDFGLALHTVQDSTSPAHHGFQVWHGLAPQWLAAATWHVAREAFDPGSGSNLDKASKWLWSFMKCPAPALPNDFFIFPADQEKIW